MVRTVDYNLRKKAVLAAAINKYIKEAVPVASEDIARAFDLSSATIRNIFNDLEKDGLLTHPYTSGGRIPTDRGYRYYVDFVISQMQLLDEEKERIGRGYQKQLKKLEDILEQTTDLLSTITHYTSIVSSLNRQDRFFYKGVSFILEEPEFQDSGRIRLLIRMLEDKQRLLSIINRDFSGRVKIYIGEEMGYPEIKNCSLAVTSYSAKKKPSGRIAVLGPMRMEYGHIIPALEYVSDVLSDALDEI